MYPNYPVMNILNAEPDIYPRPLFTLPDIVPLSVVAVSLGPEELSLAYLGLNKRYWLATFEGGLVDLRFSEGDKWSHLSTPLFTTQHDIKEMSMTFDQAGNPTLAYQARGGDLYLWFYNSEIGGYDTLSVGMGRSPKIAFDYLSTPSNPSSDVVLFYVNANNEAATRLQRERFSVEHLVGVSYGDLKLISAGKNQSSKYQVVYQYQDKGYTPPPPVPPVPPALNGDYIYMQASATQFGLEKPLINSAQHDDISIAFSFYGVNELLETLDPTWGPYGFPIFCEGGTTTTYPIPLWYNMSMYFDITGPQYGYLRETQLKASRKFSLAFMYSDNALYLILVINGKKYAPIMPFNLSDGRWTVAITGNTLTVLNDATTLFTMAVDRGQDGGSEPEPGRFGAYSLGALHNMWRQNFSGALYDITATIAGVETHYPLRTHNSVTQPSTPPGNDVTIYNHKPANWKYIAG